MNSGNWAKDFYVDYHNLNLEQLGPMVHVPKTVEKKFQKLLNKHKNNINKLFVNFLAQEKLTIKMDSPWHAWVALHQWQQLGIEITKHRHDPPLFPPTPVFRGQANSSYDVTPSLHRALGLKNSTRKSTT
jgi:hypothetical protein